MSVKDRERVHTHNIWTLESDARVNCAKYAAMHRYSIERLHCLS
jgi:hypothetical protein